MVEIKLLKSEFKMQCSGSQTSWPLLAIRKTWKQGSWLFQLLVTYQEWKLCVRFLLHQRPPPPFSPPVCGPMNYISNHHRQMSPWRPWVVSVATLPLMVSRLDWRFVVQIHDGSLESIRMVKTSRQLASRHEVIPTLPPIWRIARQETVPQTTHPDWPGKFKGDS